MPDSMNDDERLAEGWLKSRGYTPEFKPAIITKGKSPDFLAQANVNPALVWAEVKTIDPEAVTTVMGRASDIIHEASLPDGLRGHGTMHVNANTRDQSVRSLLRLYAEHAPKYRDKRANLTFIQQTPDIGGMRRVDFLDEVIPEHIWARGAGDGKIGLPGGILESGMRMATIRDGSAVREIPAYHLFDWNAPINCALTVSINSMDHPLSIGPMGGGFVSVASRVLNAVEYANGQIRNACKYLNAPGVVLIVPSPFGFIDNHQIAAAAYGRIMMSINVPSGKVAGMEHGPDAAFQPEKNRHISTIIRLNRNGSPGMYFPNFHAHHKIDKSSSLLAELVCYPPAAG